ncbi:methionyl-tRNA formyltransferase, mitochondrial [Episyrphus balteatus]|uniref:methionyl-tRNA formyltransferase, mitochondrial n=1 Tax=Episyrphus balteatus TaxID=286459 RepID=UPI002485D04F|nr:methionyl-tRNA formyltransferase, mitochondrial [Episyrphus balteatus]
MLSKITGETNFYKYKRKIYECFRLVRTFSSSPNKLKVLFFGTDNFSLPSIEVLHKSSLNNLKVSTVGVVTSFKSPSNCIKCYAEANNLQTYKWPIEPDTCKQYDLGIVVSFGHLIPSNLIKAFPLGMINVHASLLPRWRGAAPIIYSIMKGDTKTGVSIMRIEPKRFDIGDIYAQKEIPIAPDVLMPELHTILAKEGAKLLNSTLEGYPESFKNSIPQNDKEATYAPKVLHTLTEVDWNLMTANEVYNLYRALYGYKPLSTRFKDLNIKLIDIRLGPKLNDCHGSSGSIEIIRSEKCFRVRCKDCNSIDVFRVKVEGKRTMTAEEFSNGFLRKCEKSSLVFNKN